MIGWVWPVGSLTSRPLQPSYFLTRKCSVQTYVNLECPAGCSPSPLPGGERPAKDICHSNKFMTFCRLILQSECLVCVSTIGVHLVIGALLMSFCSDTPYLVSKHAIQVLQTTVNFFQCFSFCVSRSKTKVNEGLTDCNLQPYQIVALHVSLL